jgi:hypothetical protein
MIRSLVYTLHLWPPVAHAKHYTGYVPREKRLPYRLADHALGRGARLTQVQVERGGSWVLAQTEPGGHNRERQLKKHGAARRCTVCKAMESYQAGELSREQALALAGWDRASEHERALLLDMFGADQTQAPHPGAPPAMLDSSCSGAIGREQADPDGPRVAPDGYARHVGPAHPRAPQVLAAAGFPGVLLPKPRGQTGLKGRGNTRTASTRQGAGSSFPAPAAGSAEYRREYDNGWRASQRCTEDALEQARDRKVSHAWYDGYEDYAVGNAKWTKRDERLAGDHEPEPAEPFRTAAPKADIAGPVAASFPGLAQASPLLLGSHAPAGGGRPAVARGNAVNRSTAVADAAAGFPYPPRPAGPEPDGTKTREPASPRPGQQVPPRTRGRHQ